MRIHDLMSISTYFNRLKAEHSEYEFQETATGVSARSVTSYSPYPLEMAAIKVSKRGEIKVSGPEASDFEPYEYERHAIAAECEAATKADKWDRLSPIKSLDNASPLPDAFERARRETPDWFWEYRNPAGDIEMVEYRFNTEGGKKGYRRCSYWETETGLVWLEDVEPDDLPFFNGEKITHDESIFYVFEGARTARAVDRLINPKTPEEKRIAAEHPWANWFRDVRGVAIGWGGGALSPHRTDWSLLNKPGNVVYIFADRDEEGSKAAGQIARQLRKAIVHRVDFDERFPAAWDLADELPKSFFEGEKFVGPELENFVGFGAWLTEVASIGDDGKPNWKLTKQAAAELCYIAGIDRFTTRSRPFELFEYTAFNRKFAAASDCKIAELVLNNSASVFDGTDYRPGQGRSTVLNSQKVLNVWTGTRIKAIEPGTGVSADDHVRPFLNLLEAMVPDAKEREVVERWLATVIGKPERRVLFALLMISQQTGIGKTTLAERILKPLLGFQNVTFATRTDIESQFTGWLANRRLVVVSELYASGSHKLLNRLKEYITDETIRFNEKNQKAFDIHNAAHFFLSSNSYQAVQIDSLHERRLFVPRLTEKKPEGSVFRDLFEFLENGEGLGRILWWAENYKNHFAAGAEAPFTERKHEMLEDSRSEEERLLIDLAVEYVGKDAANDNGPTLVMGTQDLLSYLSRKAEARNERFRMKATDVRRIMQQQGWVDLGLAPEVAELMEDGANKRWLPVKDANNKFVGSQYPLANKAAFSKLKRVGNFEELKELAKEMYQKPFSVFDFESNLKNTA